MISSVGYPYLIDGLLHVSVQCRYSMSEDGVIKHAQDEGHVIIGKACLHNLGLKYSICAP